MQDLQKQVGARLRALREEKGLSQEELAAVCNLHRTYIGLIERGTRSLSIPTIAVICGALEVPPTRLFEGSTVEAPVLRRAAASSLSGQQLAAHIFAIRQILVDAKIVTAGRYEELLKAAAKSGRPDWQAAID